MTDQEINIAIAEACGHKIEAMQMKGGWNLYCGDVATSFYWDTSTTPELKEIPHLLLDYTTDLNAMHEAEKKLDTNQLSLYADKLDAVCVPTHSCPLTHWQAVAMATACQRAEAFLRTMGKWKD